VVLTSSRSRRRPHQSSVISHQLYSHPVDLDAHKPANRASLVAQQLTPKALVQGQRDAAFSWVGAIAVSLDDKLIPAAGIRAQHTFESVDGGRVRPNLFVIRLPSAILPRVARIGSKEACVRKDAPSCGTCKLC